ncbi:MAG: alpha/beta hydrolase [Planctomycetota bacterium]
MFPRVVVGLMLVAVFVTSLAAQPPAEKSTFRAPTGKAAQSTSSPAANPTTPDSYVLASSASGSATPTENPPTRRQPTPSPPQTKSPTLATVATERADDHDWISVDVKGVDVVWRIRTHDLEDPGPQVRIDSLDIQRSANGDWQVASADALRREAALRTTLIYVHGNRGADALAVARGAELARQLAARPGTEPFQLVIWSWPSAKTFRGRRDFLHKSERTDTEAWYLAGLLRSFPPEANVSLLGYSYGARVVTGAAHWLAGGRFEDRELPHRGASLDDSRKTPRLRAVLAAPAMHWHWLGADSVHNRALDVTDRLTILYNPSDPALRWFKLIYPCERPQALGRVGISAELLGEAAARVEQWNVEPAVGRVHDEELILRSAEIIELVGAALLDSTPRSVVEEEAAKR